MNIIKTIFLKLWKEIGYLIIAIVFIVKKKGVIHMEKEYDIRIGQIVLDEDKIIKEYGKEKLNEMWKCLDENFNRVGAKRVKHNFYISRRKTLSILFQLGYFLDCKWFAENVQTLYWYNPSNDGAEDVMKLNEYGTKRSLEEWDESCIAELSTLI